jgi:hypothetical protein
MLRAHAEAQYMPAGGGLEGTHGIELARGWERQLDTRYARLFYGGRPAAGAYRAWLQDNAVAYVALPDASLDGAGTAEAALIGGGLDYLREIWHSVHWRLYAVAPSPQLADDGARLLAWGPEGFTVAVPAAGDYEVRIHFTPYWALSGSAGCVGQAPGGWTDIEAQRPEVVNVGIAFSLLRVFSHGPRCDRVA